MNKATHRKTKRIDSDSVLKELFQAAGPSAGRPLLNREIKRFLNIEFPSTKTRRVDLLAEDVDGTLSHLEFQASNDPKMPWRELEYYVLIFQQTGRVPRQIVIYVGRGKMRMPVRIEHPMLKFEYILLDIRTIDAAPFVDSDEVEMNIIGFLCRNGATRENLRRILTNIGRCKGHQRKDALEQLATIAGLRMEPNEFFKEATEMGLRAELKENLIFRSFYNDGAVHILQTLLQTKFGELPESALTWLRTAKPAEIERAAKRFVTATRLEEVIQAPQNSTTKKRQIAKNTNGTVQ
ncbi:MAG: hypothetical protein HOP19_03565 [Acidobacteria bacterium]|nr:hypothetical protein [Acidobacteriota bacterium]